MARTTLHAEDALTAGGWRTSVRVAIEAGRIAAIEAGVEARPGDERVGLLLPGMANVHSHAFQRGMAGLAEVRGSSTDTFWTWRETMYRFALRMTPDEMQAVAGQLYVEMLEAGFTRVGEFHYLHHDPDGRPYADIAEMAGRISAAAARTGIGLTLLPVFYAHANFGGAPPHDGQRRFLSDLDGYQRLLEASRRHAEALEGGRIGVAPHSLRAVTPIELGELYPLAAGAPFHIHVAEQTREVDDCLAWSGARPVEWLLDHAPVDPRWCLIHATHMTEAETRRLAASEAVAGLCPVTEANLGDGIFNAATFKDAGGRFGIGTDSNILVGVADELRSLEYSQRLAQRARNVLAVAGGSTGQALYEAALAGGTQALGLPDAGLRAGTRADLVTLDREHPALAGRSGAERLDAWIFATHRAVDGVWVGGRKLVAEGRHQAREAVAARFRRVMEDLARA